MNDEQPATHQPAEPVWRCFHCDESFNDKEQAALHFGHSEYDKPACQIDIEHIRWMQAQHRRNVDDDSEALRTVGSLVGKHEELRRRAEEQGYARGLSDARKHPEELGLVAATPRQPAAASAGPSDWRETLEAIEAKATGGICQFSLTGKHAFLGDIREIVRAALQSPPIATAQQSETASLINRNDTPQLVYGTDTLAADPARLTAAARIDFLSVKSAPFPSPAQQSEAPK